MKFEVEVWSLGRYRNLKSQFKFKFVSPSLKKKFRQNYKVANILCASSNLFRSGVIFSQNETIRTN